MKRKTWAIVAIILSLVGIFFAFQNFTYENKKKEDDVDLSGMIEQSAQEKNAVENQVSKESPRPKLSNKGLVGPDGKMKRMRIEGTGESIAVESSETVETRKPSGRGPASTDNNRLDEEVKSALGE